MCGMPSSMQIFTLALRYRIEKNFAFSIPLYIATYFVRKPSKNLDFFWLSTFRKFNSECKVKRMFPAFSIVSK